MLIALYNRVFEESDIPLMQHMFQILRERMVQVVIFKDFYERLQPHIEFNETPLLFTGYRDLNRFTNCMISLGGDGTMLDAICFIGDTNIPVIGINLGRLGFLAAIPENEIDIALDGLIRGAYTLDKKKFAAPGFQCAAFWRSSICIK